MDATPDGSDSGDRDAMGAEDARVPSEGMARNIIVFMGDGMGPEQLAAGRFAAGGRLRLDTLAGPTLANTDSLSSLAYLAEHPNARIEEGATDSAASATAIATGVLVGNGVLSVSPDLVPYETVLEACKRAGKATGIVTTSYFYDASPAAFTAHQPRRGLSVSITHEIFAVTQPDVIMGNDLGLLDDEGNGLKATAEDAGYWFARDAVDLLGWDVIAEPRLLGIFTTDFVPTFEAGEEFTSTPLLERTASTAGPTLAQMTQRALDRLARDSDGFFLFAEDETFDQIGHNGTKDVAWANRAYPPQVAGFDAAVAVAIDWVRAHSSFDDTLIVVLADHETGGYSFDHAVGPSTGTFTTGGHTRRPIEVYALGPGSNSILDIASHTDTYRLLMGTLP